LSALPTGRRLREADIRALAPSDVQATPAARRLARQRGVDLSKLNGGGKLLREADVLQAATVGTDGLSGRRKVIAERMVASLREMAQLTVSMEVDFTSALQLRAQLRQLWDADAPSITDLVARAAIVAVASHPAVNATLVDENL